MQNKFDNGGSGMNIRQVGKRWFHCLSDEQNPLVEVEASYGNGTNYTHNEKLSQEAGYKVYDWIPARKWNLTGKGANKYRAEIIAELELFLDPCIKATEQPSEAVAEG